MDGFNSDSGCGPFFPQGCDALIGFGDAGCWRFYWRTKLPCCQPRNDNCCNNAGCNIRKPALDVTWEDWNTVVDTNLKGAFFLAQAIAKGMIERNYGRIVNIGSVTCVAGYAGLAPYGASRGGIKQMTMSLAHDWGDKGVTVNCLAPGWFKTEQNSKLFEDKKWVDYIEEKIPLGRIGKPNDLDGTCLFLSSDASAYVTGQTILVDGGISVGAVRAMPSSA